MAKTIPGSPEPEPISVHILSFFSIKSMACALSIICLSLEIVSELALIRLITLFYSIIKDLNFSSSGNVSRETFRGSNFEYSIMFESIKLYS